MDEVVKLERGADEEGRGFGAAHIQKHLTDGSVGQVSLKELMNIGEVIRSYDSLSIVRDDRGVKRVYEKEIGDTKFFAVIGERAKFERVITFYSDRNLQGTTASRSNYYNLANSNGIVIKFEPKSNISDGLKRISEVENEVLSAKEEPLYQTGEQVKAGNQQNQLFIRPTEDMKGFWQKWVDNFYRGATAIVDSKKFDDIKYIRRIRENLLLHANRGELYLDHLTEFRMRLTSGYDGAVDIGKTLSKELTELEREILTRKLEGEIAESDNLHEANINSVDMEKIDKYYMSIRDQIDANAARLQSLGALKEKDVIDGYIKRVYQKQIDEANSAAAAIFGGKTSEARGIEKSLILKDIDNNTRLDELENVVSK